MNKIPGIPDHIANKLEWVQDEYRKSSLSRTPGGVSLVIVFNDDKVYGYDKIKFPSSYIEKAVGCVMQRKIDAIYIENIENIENYINSVYVRGENNTNFTFVWEKCNTQGTLIDELKKYDLPHNKTHENLDQPFSQGSDFDLAEDFYGAPLGLSDSEKEKWIEANEHDPD